MRAELGNSRLEELPMEDGEGRSRRARDSSRIYSHPPALNSNFRPVPVNKKWSQAIQRGAFDDDDAVQVSGMDTMANGNLARQRRAGHIAYNHVSQQYTEKSHGHATPRASFAAQGRTTRPVPNKIYARDGLIGMNATLSNARPTGFTPRGPGSSRQGSNSMRTQPAASTLSRPVVSQHSVSKTKTAPPKPITQPLTPQTQSQAPQVSQNTPPTPSAQMRVVLPDGASVILQLPATIQSTAFPQRKSVPGTVFLITGLEPSDDMILFAFEDKDISEVRHRASDYTDYMTKENGLMLLFTDDDGWKLFYAVVFEHNDGRDSFITSLRKLIDRPRQKTENVVSPSTAAEESSLDTTQPASQNKAQQTIKIESPEPPVRIRPVQPEIEVPAVTVESTEPQISVKTANKSEPEQSAPIPIKVIEQTAHVAPQVPLAVQETEAVVTPQAWPVVTANASTQQPDPTIVIEPEMIKEMVTWVTNTTGYMRDCAPEDLSFDTIRAIIRATAAAVVVQYYPNFHQLSAKLRAQVVEVQCRPAVERGFLRELAKNPVLMNQLADQDADDKDAGPIATGTQSVSPQQDAEVLVKAPSRPLPPKYEVKQLIALRDKAVIPPGWLCDINETRKTTKSVKKYPSHRSLNRGDPSHPAISSDQIFTPQACTTDMAWLHPTHTHVVTDGQPAKTVGDPFGDVSQLFGGQEGQNGTVRKHGEASAIIQSNKPTEGGDLPDDTTWGGGVTRTVKCDNTHGLGVQGSCTSMSAKGAQSDLQGNPNDPQVEKIATFLAGCEPASQKKVFLSPPSGLKVSRHNTSRGSDHVGHKTNHLAGGSAHGSTYSQELSGLFGNDLNQEVAQTTENFRKLSLRN